MDPPMVESSVLGDTEADTERHGDGQRPSPLTSLQHAQTLYYSSSLLLLLLVLLLVWKLTVYPTYIPESGCNIHDPETSAVRSADLPDITSTKSLTGMAPVG